MKTSYLSTNGHKKAIKRYTKDLLQNFLKIFCKRSLHFLAIGVQCNCKEEEITSEIKNKAVLSATRGEREKRK
nr:MAG TPA: hypothetical protein [Caudoviricetes sp.]